MWSDAGLLGAALLLLMPLLLRNFVLLRLVMVLDILTADRAL